MPHLTLGHGQNTGLLKTLLKMTFGLCQEGAYKLHTIVLLNSGYILKLSNALLPFLNPNPKPGWTQAIQTEASQPLPAYLGLTRVGQECASNYPLFLELRNCSTERVS